MSIPLQTMDILGGMATELTGNPENKVLRRKWDYFIEIVRMMSVATEVMSGNNEKGSADPGVNTKIGGEPNERNYWND